jgi:hypothetical protein
MLGTLVMLNKIYVDNYFHITIAVEKFIDVVGYEVSALLLLFYQYQNT